jgi:hypothetical protein
VHALLNVLSNALVSGSKPNQLDTFCFLIIYRSTILTMGALSFFQRSMP